MKGPKPLTLVIKLGTSSIVDEKTHEPLLSILSLIVETVVKLRRDGHRIIIVSSGAIGVGLRRMDVHKRPKNLPRVQALAAIGQCRLMSLWDKLFDQLRQPIAQILLTRNDIADRSQYLNAVNTINELLEMGVIPIVNENDTLAVSEIKFGDNDTLSAITAAMVHADYLFLMTDVDCLYTKNPRTNPDAEAIEVVDDIDDLHVDVSSAGSSLGTGGMSTKIVAARLAASAGVTTVIARSSNPQTIVSIVTYMQSLNLPRNKSLGALNTLLARPLTPAGDEPAPTPAAQAPPLHTRFTPSAQPIRDRRFWLLHGLTPHGTLYIDAGAHAALREKAGLLPVGVVAVDGAFGQQEAVRIVVVERIPTTSTSDTTAASAISITSSPSSVTSVDSGATLWRGTPVEVGRALVNYSAVEIARIKGLQSGGIARVLGYADSEYVALRENISLTARGSRAASVSVGVGGVGGETVVAAVAVEAAIME